MSDDVLYQSRSHQIPILPARDKWEGSAPGSYGSGAEIPQERRTADRQVVGAGLSDRDGVLRARKSSYHLRLEQLQAVVDARIERPCVTAGVNWGSESGGADARKQSPKSEGF